MMNPSKFLHMVAAIWASTATAAINRQRVVEKFNPARHGSSNSTPMQVGNGNFAFGVDVTGLQTFQPFNTLSSWGWHNFSLPTAANQTKISDFTGLDWYVLRIMIDGVVVDFSSRWTHGRID